MPARFTAVLLMPRAGSGTQQAVTRWPGTVQAPGKGPGRSRRLCSLSASSLGRTRARLRFFSGREQRPQLRGGGTQTAAP